MERKNAGFTLAELVVVLAILGMLTTMVTIQVQPFSEKGLLTNIRADLQVLQGAGLMYVAHDPPLQYGETIAQEELVPDYLQYPVESPVHGFTYRVVARQGDRDDDPNRDVQVTLANESGEIWKRGDFIADTLTIKGY